jgi:hypothetical protein
MEASKEQAHRSLDEPPQSESLPTDGGVAVAVKDVAGRKHELDKRSLDYVLRSGLAGGLAGCAVWPTSSERDGITITDTDSRLKRLSGLLIG